MLNKITLISSLLFLPFILLLNLSEPVSFTDCRVFEKEELVSLPQLETPLLCFDTLVYNFGNCNSGQTYIHTFVGTNRSNNPIKIDLIQTSCSCTQASNPIIPCRIDPNGKVFITVKFTYPGSKAEFKEKINIRYSYGNSIKNLPLFIRGLKKG